MIALNGKKIEISQFPNKESKIENSVNDFAYFGEGYDNDIYLKFEDDKDLIHLMIIKKHLDTIGVKNVRLYCPYMPYSRMDRSVDKSVFTLKYITDFINSLNFDKVKIQEAHSDVTPALLNRCENENINYTLLKWVKDDIKFDIKNDYLFFPDAGAQKRYDLPGHKVLVGNKKRDWETGKITGLEISGEIPTYITQWPLRAVIVDDLCSYGGTFIRAAQELRKNGFEEIYLIVAHCEDSIFKGSVFKDDYFKKVYTTDSILDLNDYNVRFHKETKQLTVYEMGGII